jgi:hypothetical protein
VVVADTKVKLGGILRTRDLESAAHAEQTFGMSAFGAGDRLCR